MLAVDSTERSSKQKSDNKPAESEASGESKGKSRKFLVILMVLVIMVLLGGLSFWGFPYIKDNWKLLSSEDQESEKVEATLALDPFLVNLADTENVHFLKTTFKLGLGKEPEEEAKSDAVIAAIRDSIISLLTSKKAEQVLTPQGKDSLRQEIRMRVNAVSPKLNVLEVYIVDFVVQL